MLAIILVLTCTAPGGKTITQKIEAPSKAECEQAVAEIQNPALQAQIDADPRLKGVKCTATCTEAKK